MEGIKLPKDCKEEMKRIEEGVENIKTELESVDRELELNQREERELLSVLYDGMEMIRHTLESVEYTQKEE